MGLRSGLRLGPSHDPLHPRAQALFPRPFNLEHYLPIRLPVVDVWETWAL